MGFPHLLNCPESDKRRRVKATSRPPRVHEGERQQRPDQRVWESGAEGRVEGKNVVAGSRKPTADFWSQGEIRRDHFRTLRPTELLSLWGKLVPP